jgi:hypothetical protein
LIEYGHYVMSEIPFLFFFLAALLVADRLLAMAQATRLRSAATRPEIWGLALLLSAGFYIRSAGLASGVGIGLTLVLHRRWSESLILLLAFSLFATPWIVHSLSSPSGNPYVLQLVSVNPYYPDLGVLDAQGWLDRVRSNLEVYFRHIIPLTLVPTPYHSTYSTRTASEVGQPLWIVWPVLLVFGSGLLRELRRRDPISLAAAASLGLVLAWPPIWSAGRFLVPLVPALVYIFWSGLQRRRILPFALLALIILSHLGPWVKWPALLACALLALLELRGYDSWWRRPSTWIRAAVLAALSVLAVLNMISELSAGVGELLRHDHLAAYLRPQGCGDH